jgi:ATP-dependent DNA helicase DinG
VFDEGHHVFDAADSTFGAALTGAEAIELRRWVIGPEGKSRGRRRGLSARLADVASYDDEGATAITQAREAAELLPADGWLARIGEGAPDGPVERLLATVRATVLARDESGGTEAGYGLETEAAQLDGPMLEAAAEALEALEDLRQPLLRLTVRLEAIVEEGPDWLDGQARARIEGRAARSVAHRSAGRLDRPARAAGRPGRSRLRRLAGARPVGRARVGHGAAPPPSRSDEALCRSGAGPGARRADDLGHAHRWRRLGGAVARSGAARLDVQPHLFAAKARSTIPTRPKC